MFQKIKRIFKPPSEFEKFLKKSSFFKANFVFKIEDIDTLLNYFVEDQNNIDIFMAQITSENCFIYMIRMKILITLHSLLQNFQIGSILAEKILQQKLTFSPVKVQQNLIFKCTNSDSWILQNVQIPFIQYLKKICINIEQIELYRKFNFNKITNQNQLTDFFTLENVTNMGLGLVIQLKTALLNFPHDFLLKKLTLSLYNELCGFLKQLGAVLIPIIDQEERFSSLEMYEFFREIQIIEKKMMNFYGMHKLFDPSFKLLPPQTLKIDDKSIYYLEQCAVEEKRKYQSARVPSQKVKISQVGYQSQRIKFRPETIQEEQETQPNQK